MIRQILTAMIGDANPGQLKILIAFSLLALITAFVWIIKNSGKSESSFRSFEADRKDAPWRKKTAGGRNASQELAQARLTRSGAALLLEGIRIDGAPHEVLGVKPTASPQEIQKAYRELMKRFHPDKIGPSGTPQWKDAQRIAEAINAAKDALLKTSR